MNILIKNLGYFFILEQKNTDTLDVLKFWTLICLQKGLDKQGKARSNCFSRSSLVRVFPVCYSDKRFVNFSPETQILYENRKRKVLEILEYLQ